MNISAVECKLSDVQLNGVCLTWNYWFLFILLWRLIQSALLVTLFL